MASEQSLKRYFKRMERGLLIDVPRWVNELNIQIPAQWQAG